jgi:hypothetical protein
VTPLPRREIVVDNDKVQPAPEDTSMWSKDRLKIHGIVGKPLMFYIRQVKEGYSVRAEVYEYRDDKNTESTRAWNYEHPFELSMNGLEKARAFISRVYTAFDDPFRFRLNDNWFPAFILAGVDKKWVEEVAPLLDFVDAALKGEEVCPELYAAFMGGHHGSCSSFSHPWPSSGHE